MITDAQSYASSFSSYPDTTCPVSLTNLQVNVVGNNISRSKKEWLANYDKDNVFLFSNYEKFISQVNLEESLTPLPYGETRQTVRGDMGQNTLRR